MSQDGSFRANRAFEVGLRAGLENSLGNVNSFTDDSNQALRKHYEVFGWPTDPSEEDYLALYLRNAIAQVVNDKPALSTWRDSPEVVDPVEQEDTTEFEDAVNSLVRNFDLWNYGARVDRVAGVGEHGLLAIGFSDVEGDMSQWAEDARESNLNGLDDINTFKPLLQTQITDIDEGGPDSERWGKPEMYKIDWSQDIATDEEVERGPSLVHWTRVIDVPATRLLDDETYARPRFEPVLNNILDIEKTLGSSAEQSYRGADYGLHLNFDPEKVDPNSIDTDEMRDEFERWYHGLQPEFKTVGGELETLGGEMQDPSGIVENNLKMIFAETGIPENKFLGTQQGQTTGSEQDEKAFFGMIAERREQYANRHIVKPLIRRLESVGVLPSPQAGMFDIEWPDLTQPSNQEVAETQSTRAEVVAQAGPVIGLTGDRAETYIETGDIPERDDTAPMPPETEQTQNQFEEQFDL